MQGCGRENWHARLGCVCFRGTSTVIGKVKPEALGSGRFCHMAKATGANTTATASCVLWLSGIHTHLTRWHTQGAVGAGCLLSEHLTPALSKISLCLRNTLSCFIGKSAEISDQKLERCYLGNLCRVLVWVRGQSDAEPYSCLIRGSLTDFFLCSIL